MIHIGTSGWHYKHWEGSFYPPGMPKKEYLNYYMKEFSTVEINNSFYQMPKESTLRNWRKTVPPKFVFAVKASRYITHVKKLKNPSKGAGNFLNVIEHLGVKLGPILFQLPPGWKCNRERLKEFLEYLPQKYRYAFEFRNADWFHTEVVDLLRQHHCAFCIYDLDRHLSPLEVTTDFVYIRLHGPGKAYQGSYDENALKEWAQKIMVWKKEKKDIYCYFDNDQAGYAVQNAIKLKQMIEK